MGDLPMPRDLRFADRAPNAFAFGRDLATAGVRDGRYPAFANDEELKAVLGHELRISKKP